MQNGERVSSTRIRKALEVGDLKTAQLLLGSPFFMFQESWRMAISVVVLLVFPRLIFIYTAKQFLLMVFMS